MNERIQKHIEIVTQLHEGQVDKAGKPYVTHPIRVMQRLPEDATEAEKIGALYHDTVEDTEATFESLREETDLSETELTIIELLTKDPKSRLTYQQRINRLAATGNVSALRVKIADNEDNSDPERIAQFPPEQQSIARRYHRSIKTLKHMLRLIEHMGRPPDDHGSSGEHAWASWYEEGDLSKNVTIAYKPKGPPDLYYWTRKEGRLPSAPIV